MPQRTNVVVNQQQTTNNGNNQVASGIDNGTSNWQRGHVNVDQKTPWDTTGTINSTQQQQPLQQQQKSVEWKNNGSNNSGVNQTTTNNGSWGQPAVVVNTRAGANSSNGN